MSSTYVYDYGMSTTFLRGIRTSAKGNNNNDAHAYELIWISLE